MCAMCGYTWTVRTYAMPLVTLTPRINIPYAPRVRGFADCQWPRRARGETSWTLRKHRARTKRPRDGFSPRDLFHSSIRQYRIPSSLSLRLPWRIRLYEADQGRFYVDIGGMSCCEQLVPYINGNTPL